MKDGIGLYLGLTGARLNAADVMELGLATHYIERGRLNDLMSLLMDGHVDTAEAGKDSSMKYLQESRLVQALS